MMTETLWYLGAGFLLGWITSTLIEWLWFRQRRRQDITMARVASRREVRPDVPDSSLRAEEPPQSVGAEALYRPYRPRRLEESVAPLTAAQVRERLTTPSPVRVANEASITTARQPAPVASSISAARAPDPLSKIRGIGVVYERRLYEAGIFTWHQLAHTDVEQLRTVTNAHTSSDPAAWREQAQRLAIAYGRVGAVYNGPIPDKFTYIDGLSAHHEQELYQAGILTYTQLAALSPQVLARILPESDDVDEDIDFQLWIEQAAQLNTHA